MTPKKFLLRLIQSESFSGILLIFVTALALFFENSSLRGVYHGIFHYEFTVGVGSLSLHQSVSHWINDGLMVIFFLLVGLEIKRELLEGHLASPAQRVLPVSGAIGGMAVPAFIYLFFNHADSEATHGWAIPSATDIAFALGVLSLLGSRVPISLKVFLTALAIIDDLGAVIIIALFYTAELHIPMLIGAGIVFALLGILNRRGVTRLWPYLILGIPLWLFVLASGVHATIAGVLLALTVPAKRKNNSSPLEHLEERLLPWVNYGIMPLFAFANAGLPLDGLSAESFTSPVCLGVMLGLFLGKQLGIFLASAAVIKFGWARLPQNATFLGLYGVSIVGGIGFTMSLFIASLAFTHVELLELTRLGVLVGSALSAIVGMAVMLLVGAGEKRQSEGAQLSH